MSLEWWEANKSQYIRSSPKDLVPHNGPYGFCGSCGTRVITRDSAPAQWKKYFMYGAWGCTPEKAKEILQVVDDPLIVTYTLTHDGETHTFLWKDE